MGHQREAMIDPSSTSSEPFRGLHLAIRMRAEAAEGNAVLFTSPAPAAGKSTLALNYATVAAQNETRVLLIDADLSRAGLHKAFSLERAPGLSDELLKARFARSGNGARRRPLTEATHRVSSSGMLELLPAGSPVPRPSDVTGSAHMSDLIERARREYDLVVIDSPPVLGPADASNLASMPNTDVVVVVTQASRRRPLVRALRQLELVHANVLGVVINRARGMASYEYEY